MPGQGEHLGDRCVHTVKMRQSQGRNSPLAEHSEFRYISREPSATPAPEGVPAEKGPTEQQQGRCYTRVDKPSVRRDTRYSGDSLAIRLSLLACCWQLQRLIEIRSSLVRRCSRQRPLNFIVLRVAVALVASLRVSSRIQSDKCPELCT